MLKEKKLGKVAVNYLGLLRVARSLKKMYGHHKNFNNKEYLLDTSLVPSRYKKKGKQVYTIARDNMAIVRKSSYK